MRDEIAAAVVFITRIVKKNKELSQDQVENFSNKLTTLLVEKFKNHWYRDNPLKGQGYRCIRVNSTGPVDPVLYQAAKDTGLEYADLKMPAEMTLWVDPLEVCCRFGEYKGSYCTVAAFRGGRLDNRAGTVNIDGAILKHEVRKSSDSTASPQSTLNRKSRCNTTVHRHNNTASSTQFNVNAKPFRSKFSPTSFSDTFMPEYGDPFHWVRGVDLVQA